MRFYRKQSDGASFWPALADLILAVLLLTMILLAADSAIQRALDIFYPRPKPSETLIDKKKLKGTC
jgi:hypothetical protein